MAFHSEITQSLLTMAKDIDAEANKLRFMFRLAADFLDEFSDRLGNAGCNDWEWPEWLPEEQRRLISEIVQRGNGGEPFGGVPMDFMAVDATAEFLRSLC